MSPSPICPSTLPSLKAIPNIPDIESPSPKRLRICDTPPSQVFVKRRKFALIFTPSPIPSSPFTINQISVHDNVSKRLFRDTDDCELLNKRIQQVSPIRVEKPTTSLASTTNQASTTTDQTVTTEQPSIKTEPTSPSKHHTSYHQTTSAYIIASTQNNKATYEQPTIKLPVKPFSLKRKLLENFAQDEQSDKENNKALFVVQTPIAACMPQNASAPGIKSEMLRNILKINEDWYNTRVQTRKLQRMKRNNLLRVCKNIQNNIKTLPIPIETRKSERSTFNIYRR